MAFFPALSKNFSGKDGSAPLAVRLCCRPQVGYNGAVTDSQIWWRLRRWWLRRKVRLCCFWARACSCTLVRCPGHVYDYKLARCSSGVIRPTMTLAGRRVSKGRKELRIARERSCLCTTFAVLLQQFKSFGDEFQLLSRFQLGVQNIHQL